MGGRNGKSEERKGRSVSAGTGRKKQMETNSTVSLRPCQIQNPAKRGVEIITCTEGVAAPLLPPYEGKETSNRTLFVLSLARR